MLVRLDIQSIAVIESLTVMFEPGFNVITGESGAGKSVLLEAIALLQGERAPLGIVRNGAKKAVVEAMFTWDHVPGSLLDVVRRLDLPFSDEDRLLLVRREITDQGRSSAKLNGKIVPLAVLREVVPLLFRLNRQHSVYQLVDAKNHLFWIDQYGQSVLNPLKEMYQEAFETYRAAYERWQNLTERREKTLSEKRYLEEALQEIDQAALQPEEEARLKKERERLRYRERILKNLSQAYQVLSGEHQALDRLRVARALLQEASGWDEDLGDVFERLETLIDGLEEVSYRLRDVIEEEPYEEGRLDQIEKRLIVIDRLKIKYGDTVEAILKFRDKAYETLTALEETLSQEPSIQKELEAAFQSFYRAGRALSEARRTCAKKLQDAVTGRLGDLYLGHAKFEAVFSDRTPDEHDAKAPSPGGLKDGFEQVVFYFQANPGDELRPLAEVASGGELSRVALALSAALAHTEEPMCLIFDEIDTGVGGKIGEAIGKLLTEISRRHQVISVTHLPQVAAFADLQWLMQKNQDGAETVALLTPLDESSRVQELARMLGGAKLTATAHEHARSLIAQAREHKKSAMTSNVMTPDERVN
ncbi:MAG: DNA repair protein RecN [Candidatus Carbobacillus altaicus]|nr:DNA repair protein RecN [Candidatus Carbobacillus altaicus]